jgi:hypothetical protein
MKSVELRRLCEVTLVRRHEQWLKKWYARPPSVVRPGRSLMALLREQHFCNYVVWGLEDQARRRDVPAGHIANTKRGIDKWNQRRNDIMERLDIHTLAAIGKRMSPRAPLHSESFGMMLDRLSIIALKLRHMRTNARRRDDRALAAECARRCAILEEQRKDLLGCLRDLLDDVAAGRRRVKVYYQLKQYNDRRLNPHLRGCASTQAGTIQCGKR